MNDDERASIRLARIRATREGRPLPDNLTADGREALFDLPAGRWH